MNNKTFKHECPNCNRYFICGEEKKDQFCFKCGQGMEISNYKAYDSKDKVHYVAMKILLNKELKYEEKLI